MRKARTARPGGAGCILPARTREFSGSRYSAMENARDAVVWVSHRGRARSISTRPGRNRLHLIGESTQMNRPVVKAGGTRPCDPDQGVLEPVLVVTLGKILARLRAPAFSAVGGGMDGGRGL